MKAGRYVDYRIPAIVVRKSL